MQSRQSGIQGLQAAHSSAGLWSAMYRAIVEAVYPGDAPPTVDVTIFRYNTRFSRVPVAQMGFTSALPQVGDTVAIYQAEGVRDNAWVSAWLPRSDNSQPLPTPEAWRLLHPSGVVLQVDDGGNVAAIYPSGATVSLGGQDHTEVATTNFRVSGVAATGTATFNGTAGTVIPQALPMTGGGYLWYTTASATIGSSGVATASFVCATGGTGPNGSGPSSLAFPFVGVTSVSGTASGGAQATSAVLDAASITLGGTTPVARKGDPITVTVSGTTYTGQISGGSSVVTAG